MSNYLHGPLPSFNQLRLLEVINLQSNQFTGSLPISVYNSPLLRELDISINLFTGPIYLRNISESLESFIAALNYFSAFYFTGMEEFKVYHLNSILISQNNISSPLTQELCYLRELQYLDLASNHFSSSIPDCIGNMTKLEKVDFYKNSLVGSIPISFWNISTLTEIKLSSNSYLRFNVSEVFTPALRDVIVLQLNLNYLYGTLPPAVKYLENIVTMDLGNNFITGSIPEELYDLTSLSRLDISVNLLIGTLGNNIGNMNKLEAIGLSYNSLHGTLPNSIRNLTRLKALFLNENQLDGTLPSMRELKLLNELYLNQNQFTGPFPDSVYHLANLYSIDISYNNLQMSSLPESLRVWTKVMAYLSLSGVNLYGNLKGLCDLPHLQQLFIADNYLTGSIPDCVPTSMITYAVYANYLTGSIPPSLVTAPQLSQLELFDNSLTGDVSNFYFNSTSLSVVTLQFNHFSGTLDRVFDSLTNSSATLNLIGLSENFFSGTIPETLEHLTALTQLSIDDNCFYGAIPHAICSLSKLSYVTMEGLNTCQQASPSALGLIHSYFASYIDGGIPDCLFQLPLLSTLKLSGNGLSGTIPDIPQSSQLSVLTLSNNRLSSTIPHSLLIHNLTYLDLSYNHLNGTLNGIAQNPYLSANGFDLSYVVNTTVYLQSNRLSGNMPRGLLNVETINVLSDNTFSCESELPHRDPYYDAYSCGSETMNNPLIIFGTFVGVMLIVVWVVTHFNPYQIYQKLMKYRHVVHSLTLSPSSHTTEISRYLLLLQFLRRLSMAFCGLLLLIGGVLYPVMKKYFHTVTYQYGWVFSAAYMSGDIPAGLMLLVHVVCVLLIILSIMAHNNTVIVEAMNSSNNQSFQTSMTSTDSRSNVNQSTLSNENHGDKLRRFLQSHYSHFPIRNVLLFIAVSLINIAIVCAVNIVYSLVYIESNNASVILFARFAVSLFQISWNLVVIPVVLGSMDTESRYRPVRMCVYMSLIYFFNTVVVPCIASLVALSTCFKNLFIGYDSITSVLQWTSSIRVVVESLIFLIDSKQSYTITFTPPFVYSGQCSSGIMVSYIPVFMLMYIFQMIFVPCAYITLCHISHRSVPPWIRNILPSIAWPQLTSFSRGFPVKTHNTIASLMVDFGVLLTFGCMSPPLAVIICACIISKTYTKELMVGRYIHQCIEEEDKTALVNVTFSNIWDCSVLLRVEEQVSGDIYNSVMSLESHRSRQSIMVMMKTSTGVNSRDSTRLTYSEPQSQCDTFNKGTGIVPYMEMPPLDWLERACKGMWRSPWRCMWFIVFMSIPFYVFLCFDMTNVNVWSLVWIVPIDVGFVTLLYVFRHEIIKLFRSRQMNETQNLPQLSLSKLEMNSSFTSVQSPFCAVD